MIPEFPHYFKQQITVLNKEAHVSVVTYWSKRSVIQELLKNSKNEENVLSIGNLYTFDGFKYIILNSFLSKTMSSLVFYGNDMNNIESQIKAVFDSKSDEYKKIVDQLSKSMNEDIPDLINKFITRFKDHVHFIEFGNIEKLSAAIIELKNIEPMIIEPKFYNYEYVVKSSTYPSEKCGFCVRDNNLQRLWKKVIHKIIEFGELKPRKSIGESYYELIDFTYILESEDRDSESIIETDEFPLSEDFLKKYVQEIISPEVPEGLSYTYGNRIHRQLDATIKKLQSDNSTRQAHISLWGDSDVLSLTPPCLTDIDMNVQSAKLYLTCHFRSHDAFAALRANMYGLLQLQKLVCSQLKGIEEGPLIIIANSSHIYERDMDNAQNKIKYNSECNADKRGYFTISVEEDKTIGVKHFNKDNELLHEWFISSSSFDVKKMDEISFYISDIHHAMYIMKEVCIAMKCIHEGRHYVQDETKL